MTVVRSRIAAAAVLVMLGGLAACGSDQPKDKLSGSIGPGSGGPAVGALTWAPLTKPDGDIIGSFGYDAGFFLLAPPSPPGGMVAGALVNVAGYSVSMTLSHIAGRPDTPCRFTAAVLARDGGYQIGDTGFRTNDSGQQLYQVNLSAAGSYVRLYCANLRDNVGAQFSVLSDAPDELDWLQVHATLNSVHAQ